jgi:hypothetical protein
VSAGRGDFPLGLPSEGERMVKKLTTAAAVSLALLVAGCAANNSSSQPPTQRNSLGQAIDPQTGLAAPGAPGNGGY